MGPLLPIPLNVEPPNVYTMGDAVSDIFEDDLNFIKSLGTRLKTLGQQ